MTTADATVTFGACGCQPVPGTFRVQWQGAQREVLAGDIGGRVDLLPLRPLADLYGLGPLAEVKGEITILDSRCHVATVKPDGGLAVEESFAHRACFLVYSRVAKWQRVPLPEGVTDEKELERELPALAKAHGIDPSHPFPFRLKGRPGTVAFHVLNKTDGLPHSPEGHERAKAKYVLVDAEAEMIGFHSLEHRGIFTPGHSAIHLHMRSADGAVSGHVDALKISRDLEFYLPHASR